MSARSEKSAVIIVIIIITVSEAKVAQKFSFSSVFTNTVAAYLSNAMTKKVQSLAWWRSFLPCPVLWGRSLSARPGLLCLLNCWLSPSSWTVECWSHCLDEFDLQVAKLGLEFSKRHDMRLVEKGINFSAINREERRHYWAWLNLMLGGKVIQCASSWGRRWNFQCELSASNFQLLFQELVTIFRNFTWQAKPFILLTEIASRKHKTGPIRLRLCLVGNVQSKLT